MWVERFNQCYFLGSAPSFDFFLAGNCGASAGVWFKSNEFGRIVFLGETRDELSPVLEHALGKLTRYAEVEHTRFASHEINVEGALHKNRIVPRPCRPANATSQNPAPSFRTTGGLSSPFEDQRKFVIPNGAGRFFLPLHFLFTPSARRGVKGRPA